MPNLLDDAFSCLELANDYEEKEEKSNAAMKYYEGCYLLKRYLERLPISSDENQSKGLLLEKIKHYEERALSLLQRSGGQQSMKSTKNNSKHSLLPTSQNPDVRVLTKATQSTSSRHLATYNSITKLIANKASLADSYLNQALDLDESAKEELAIGRYMSSAELYLEAMKIAEKAGNEMSATAALLRRRLETVLDRVEQLKDPNKKKKLNNNPKMENKREDDSQPLSKEEILILKRASLIASGLFLPWLDREAQELSVTASTPSNSLFTDPDGPLKLSESQRKKFHKWARPAEIIARRGLSAKKLAMVNSITPYTIRQKYVTDCSMVASLCVCSAYERRFKKQLITSILYPKNAQGMPVINPNGKYFVKLWLNGIARCVIVDDFFPIDKNGNLLCSHTASSGLELWVSIIEKAYMKLCGGYDFPGSNSGVDLFALTGWIPERLFFPKDAKKIKDHETPSDRAWERLYGASSYGDCLISVSSSPNLTQKEAEKLGLVIGHAYAVLRVFQSSNGIRLLQLKNPWAHKSWQGKFSPADSKSWADQNLRDEVGYDPKVARYHDDGVFWIGWSDVIIYFQTLHLSWNPALFKYKQISHGYWPASRGPNIDTFNIGENPQFILKFSDNAIKNKASIWFLISKHVNKEEQEGCEVNDYLTGHLYKNNEKGEKIFYPGDDNNILRGAYTNNPHVLLRYDVDSEFDKHISLVLSQYDKKNDIGYTLSCYCNESFKIGKPVPDLPFCSEIESTWKNSGGSPNNSTFTRNPMFGIQIPNAGSWIQLRCSATKSSAVNVMLVQVEKFGQKINRLIDDPILDSGHYRFGYVITEKKFLPSGNYVLVASTFSPGQRGTFRIQVFSSVKLSAISKNPL